jgi:hypothetical protein
MSHYHDCQDGVVCPTHPNSLSLRTLCPRQCRTQQNLLHFDVTTSRNPLNPSIPHSCRSHLSPPSGPHNKHSSFISQRTISLPTTGGVVLERLVQTLMYKPPSARAAPLLHDIGLGWASGWRKRIVDVVEHFAAPKRHIMPPFLGARLRLLLLRVVVSCRHSCLVHTR